MSAAHYNEIKIQVNANNTVTLWLIRRDKWGATKRSQFSVGRRAFQEALLDANLTIPWKDIIR